MSESRTWIELSDGVRLAANLYLPDGHDPAPVLLEALPYRKDDLTAGYTGEYRRLRDEGGYAVARVDVRGTGSSEGLAEDEYPAQEQRDLCEVIAWLARQPWSSGAIGMYGTSYSGFNSIQLAMERPPELKAIVAIYATDDRYTDDVHYEGGALRALDFIDYCLYMTPMNALPPVPSLYGDGWRDLWRQRFEKNEPWLIRWLEEQSDGPYWRHGSLRPHYEAIECPTMIIAGWADGYRNATFRMFEALTAPRRMLIGPWPHASTETGLPGPHIDLVPEMIRWWDRWLKGVDNGIDREPPITLFVRRSTRPEPDLEEIRGDWRTEPGWPLERVTERPLVLSSALGVRDDNEAVVVRPDVGVTAHLSCAGVMPWGQPSDQRPDDAYSLVYDWAVPDELEILGYPRLEVEIAADAPVAFVSAKLNDVFEDGTSALVSRGFLNLTHRDGHTDPSPLEPHRPYRVTINLSATSWIFEPGHRLRLALAGTDWPNVWSPPQAVTLSLIPATSTLFLPVASPAPQSEPPTLKPRTASTKAAGSKDRVEWRNEHDVLARETRVIVDHGSTYDTESGAHVEESYFGKTSVARLDPGTASAEGRVRFTLRWPEATVATEAHAILRSDAREYHLDLQLEAFEDGERRWQRSWRRSFPRRLQ